MKTLFCYIYKFWLSKFVDSKDDFLVRIIDAAAGSECKYCMAIRCLMMGFGLGLGFSIGFGAWLIPAGVAFCVTALLLTLGERHWLCEVKKHE